MKLKVASVALIVVLLSVFTIAPLATEAQAAAPTTGTLTTPITGTAPGGNTLNGVLTITNFTSQNGTLNAVGTLTGTITNALGQVLGTVTNVPVTLPVTGASATCPILNLTLGPINLNLLGLVVTTNQINLNITAVPGAGNLLGNLLCAVSNLLNGGAPLTSITGLLNNILRALGL